MGGIPMNLNDPKLVGTSILATALFFLVAFASNTILRTVTAATLGITVGLTVVAFIGLLILILIVL